MNAGANTLTLLALSALCLPGRALCQDSYYQYAAKVVCGRAPEPILAPGEYFTAVNVHNSTDAPMSFQWKVAVALPGRPGQVSPFDDLRLGPDQAIELDCHTMLRRVHEERFLKGFAVLRSRIPLDVVAVYSAQGPTQAIETLDVEYVPERRGRGCVGPDLVVESIARPSWDAANSRSVITAVVKNVGNADASASLARVIDPTTPQPSGAPYSAVSDVPPLAPGASFTAVFYLPYWVYNPDVTLEVTADYKGQVEECNEQNNTNVFKDIG
jgi:hypothetical protein